MCPSVGCLVQDGPEVIGAEAATGEDRQMKEEEQLEESSDRLSLRGTAAFFHCDSYNL